MKTYEYQQDIGGTAACMKRIMKDIKGWGKLSSKYALFGNSWFRIVKTQEEVNAEELYCC